MYKNFIISFINNALDIFDQKKIARPYEHVQAVSACMDKAVERGFMLSMLEFLSIIGQFQCKFGSAYCTLYLR